jgi:hypothetical protein
MTQNRTRRDQNQKDRSKNWVANFKDRFFWSIRSLSHSNRIDRSLYESGHFQEPCDARELWLLNIAQTMVTFLFSIVEILFMPLVNNICTRKMSKTPLKSYNLLNNVRVLCKHRAHCSVMTEPQTEFLGTRIYRIVKLAGVYFNLYF